MNRILVVEDDPQLQLLYRSVLERAGFSVITALNGEDALKKLEATRIELIITDIMIDDIWVDEPKKVKEAVRMFFLQRF